MDMEQAAFWLAGCILVSLGLVVLMIACVIINNLLHTFWKPVKIFTPDSWKGFFPPERLVHHTEHQNNVKTDPEIKPQDNVKTK